MYMCDNLVPVIKLREGIDALRLAALRETRALAAEDNVALAAFNACMPHSPLAGDSAADAALWHSLTLAKFQVDAGALPTHEAILALEAFAERLTSNRKVLLAHNRDLAVQAFNVWPQGGAGLDRAVDTLLVPSCFDKGIRVCSTLHPTKHSSFAVCSSHVDLGSIFTGEVLEDGDEDVENEDDSDNEARCAEEFCLSHTRDNAKATTVAEMKKKRFRDVKPLASRVISNPHTRASLSFPTSPPTSPPTPYTWEQCLAAHENDDFEVKFKVKKEKEDVDDNITRKKAEALVAAKAKRIQDSQRALAAQRRVRAHRLRAEAILALATAEALKKATPSALLKHGLADSSTIIATLSDAVQRTLRIACII